MADFGGSFCIERSISCEKNAAWHAKFDVSSKNDPTGSPTLFMLEFRSKIINEAPQFCGYGLIVLEYTMLQAAHADISGERSQQENSNLSVNRLTSQRPDPIEASA